MKSDHRMNRTPYKGVEGDAVNATLSTAGFNLRKLLAFFYACSWGGFLTFDLPASAPSEQIQPLPRPELDFFRDD